MARTYQLTEHLSVLDDTDKLIVKTENGTDFIVRDTDIKRADKDGEKSLSAAEKKSLCRDILRAEFAIPETQDIASVKLKQNKKDKFHLSISAGTDDNLLQADLKYNADSVEISQETASAQVTSHSRNTDKRKTNASSNKTDRMYNSQKVSAHKYPYQTFEDKRSLSFKRTVDKKGKLLTLTREEDKLDDDGFITRHREALTITITGEKISKTNQIKDDAYKHIMQISFDVQTQAIDCSINDTKFEDITIVEYKNNALTAKTGIKTKVTKYIDRDFNAHLHLNADGSFTYTQEQTGSDGKLISYKTESEFGKVPSEMTREIEKIKAVAAKLNILKNNPKTAGQLDFTQNPNIFDEEIGFSDIKDENPARLVETLAHGHAETNRRLLAAVVQNTDSGTLRLAMQNKNQNA